MRNATLAVAGIAVILVGFALFGTLFTINQREQALVLQLGEPRRVVTEPGLHFKIPIVQSVVRFDKRVLEFDNRAEEVPTQDQKQLVVDAFARYRISDPLRFFQTVGNELGIDSRMQRLVNANLRAVFGEVTLATLLTPQRAQLVFEIARRVQQEGRQFGIDVIDVRIKRVDLPEENSQAIFRRMQTQREQEARRIRAEGERDARRIRADADKQATIIRANAQRVAEKTRGEGEGDAQRIYNEAYGQDMDFYFFWDSMRALEQGLQRDTTTYVGPPDGDFFRFFYDASGALRPGAREDGLADGARNASGQDPRRALEGVDGAVAPNGQSGMRR